MAKKKTGMTRAERRAAYKAKEKAQEEELQDMEAEVPGVETIPELEPVEKDMDSMGSMYYMGPTSFEDLDQLNAAKAQASQVRQVTYETEELIWNILNHPMKDPAEKAKAIRAVGTGFEERLGKVATVKKDLDVLVIEAILATDKRHSGPFEFVKEFISKAKLTASAENALSDEQFALVRGEGDKKERKYPIHDKTHVRNALARAAQMIEAGGEAAADAKAALPKIRAAAKKMGIEMSMEKDNNAILIEKDQNGDWRWVGWVSNNFIDFDGEIIKESAHQEYVEWLEKNPDMYPVSTTWHKPGLVRKSAVDFATVESGFLIMSGKLTEDEAEALLKAKALTDLGMSHGSFALARDPNDPRVITKYRMYECSDLPLENAANPFTNFETLSKEVDMDQAKYLAPFFGGDEEKAKAFLAKADVTKKALQEAGVESKEKQEETPAAPAVADPPADPPIAKVATPAPVEANALLEQLKKELGVEELSETIASLLENAEKIPVLEALVKDLQGSRDEQLAEILTPPAAKFSWMQKARPSASETTVVKDEEEAKLKESAPGIPEGAWLSKATHTEPVQVQ